MTTFKKTMRRLSKKFHALLGADTKATRATPKRKYVRKAKPAAPIALTTEAPKADPILGG